MEVICAGSPTLLSAPEFIEVDYRDGIDEAEPGGQGSVRAETRRLVARVFQPVHLAGIDT